MAFQYPNNEVPMGNFEPSSILGEFNAISFVIQQAISKMQTAALVMVESCTNSGGLSAVGFVNVVPMVNQVDSMGNQEPHTTIYNLPYFRIQGGANAIIIDPSVGDIGICVFSSRDISKIKSTKSKGNPDSSRQFSFSDGLYIGGVLNVIPSQYVQINNSGIKIYSPTQVSIESPSISLNGHDFATHIHSGVVIGTNNTGAPV